VEYVTPPPWEAGRQGILNALEAQVPQHTFGYRIRAIGSRLCGCEPRTFDGADRR
jgi:hypothetical protein